MNKMTSTDNEKINSSHWNK